MDTPVPAMPGDTARVGSDAAAHPGVLHREAVTALLRRQLPDSTGIVLGQPIVGPNVLTWRAGEHWAIRLPRTADAEARMGVELDWLPRIGRNWAFTAPVPGWVGRADDEFPHRWAVVPWIAGEPADTHPLGAGGARALGTALREIHQPAPPEAPRNPVRTATLAQRAPALASMVERAAAAMPRGFRLDVKGAMLAFESGAKVPRPVPTWTHLRLDGATVLTRDGALGGIIGWSGAGAADPAIDLAHALILVGGDLWDELLEGYGGIDAAMFARARAESVAHACALATTGTGVRTAISWLGLASLGLLDRAR